MNAVSFLCKWLGIVASLSLASLPCRAVEIGVGGAVSCELITDIVSAGRDGGSAINWATGYITASIETARGEGKDFTDVDEPMNSEMAQKRLRKAS